MWPAGWLLVLAACRPDVGVSAGEPRLVELPSLLDVGEVPVGQSVTLTLTLENEGIGDLHTEASLEGTEEMALVEVPEVIAAGGTASLKLRYAPDADGADEAVLTLTTDDASQPEVLLTVTGLGVTPDLKLSPESLWFGGLESTDTLTRSTALSSVGTGDVTVADVVFEGDGGACAASLPEALPLTLAPGRGVTLSITCEGEGLTLPAEAVVVSDDLDAPYLPLRLLGDGSEGDEPPEVAILTPSWGSAWLDTEALTVAVQAIDPDDSPENLLVLLYLDDALVGSDSPDADGRTAFSLGTLAPGDHTLLARALDPEGNTGEDTVDLDVQDADEPLTYALSGGASVYDWWSVDDDVRIDVDGVTLFEDVDGHRSTHAPVTVPASVGSTIRIVATDENACRKALDDLVLHFGTSRSQDLLEATSASACTGDSDYDPAYEGPWPNVFLDVTVTVAIP